MTHPSTADSTTDLYEDYFEKRASESIAEQLSEEPYNYTLNVTELYKYDEDLVADTDDGLIRNPDDHMQKMRQALAEVADLKPSEITIRIGNPPERMKTPIRSVREEHIGRLLFLEGSVAKATDVRPKVQKAVYQCRHCGSSLTMTVDDEELPPTPKEQDCKNSSRNDNHSAKRKMSLDLEASNMEDYQRLRLQESPDEAGGDNPKNIDVNITGSDISGVALAGQKITASGVLRVKQQDDDLAVLVRHIECTDVERVEGTNMDLEPTPDELDRIKELSNDPRLFQKLAESIEPTIQGYEQERKGVVLQLFGGVAKKFPNSGDIRGDIHILFVGDPGTGKSRILKYVAELSPTGGVFTSGKSTSSAGLTAAAVRDQEFGGNDKWTLKAGALVMADQGHACVDELDKMDEQDRSALHEALEQQQVSISKAGITATLNSRCSLLAAANPIYGRFDELEAIQEQIDLEPALFSRFDLIFVIQDDIEEERDRGIASQILDNNQKGQQNARKRKKLLEESDVESMKEVDDEIDSDETAVEAPVSKELFQKYIHYAKNNYTPEITEDAKQYLEDQYVELRQQGVDDDVYPETARAIEGLVRLTEATAKARLSERATMDHADFAFNDIYMHYKREVGMDPESNQFDADMLETGQSSTQRDRVKSIVNAVKSLNENPEEDYTTEEEVIEYLSDQGFDKSNVEDELEKMKREGEQIYSPNLSKGYLAVE